MSLERFAEAEAAMARGQRDEAIRLMVEQLTLDPKAPIQVYRNFSAMLIRSKRYEDGAQWSRQWTEVYPRDATLWNNLGVSWRRLARYEEALAALRQSQKLDPKSNSAPINMGNVYNDMKDGRRSVDTWTKLVRSAPTNAEFQRSLGRGLMYSGEPDKAEMRFRLAVKLKPDYEDAWIDLVNLTTDSLDPLNVIPIIDQALSATPSLTKLCEIKAMLYRRLNRNKEAEAYLLSLIPVYGDVPWLHNLIGTTISEWDRERAHGHMRKAIELDPTKADYRMALAESLSRTRGPKESEFLEQAYHVLKGAEGMLELNPSELKVASEIFTRLADYDASDSLASFEEIGRKFASNGKHTALLLHLSRVRSDADRHELVTQHKMWGDAIQAQAIKQPITFPVPRPADGKIRIGFMSSDLRGHPVAYFALPLLEHYDKSRFEVYCYSYFLQEEDSLQKRITEMVDGFRWRKEVTERDAAQMIADDQLDMLIELGGTTHMNKLAVMAFKAAPLQASWLGYPHSAGLTSIDRFILDPYVVPEDRSLVIEEPLLMPKSWIAMGELAFPERPITPGTPESRKGFLTYGTANNPYKYSKAMVQTWARIVAATPNAQFLFVRPEAGSPTFRTNIEAIFEGEGVSKDRVRFESIRGAHMPFYNEIDISLDTFPQTGGTTTCESLFMGVPVITLVGPAVFERLSYSILNNAGLGDLCAFSEREYVEKALGLAADAPRRTKLRTDLREMLKQSPLGQTRQFATDFFSMIEGAVAQSRAAKAA